MAGLLSQVFRMALAAVRGLAPRGRSAGTCRCGWALYEVAGDGRGWCRRCGFAPDEPEKGWLAWCPSCRFGLGQPDDSGHQVCGHCHWIGTPDGKGRPLLRKKAGGPRGIPRWRPAGEK